MLQLGLSELFVLSLLAVVLIKPEHIPVVMRSLGGGLAKLKRIQNQVSQELTAVSRQKDHIEGSVRSFSSEVMDSPEFSLSTTVPFSTDSEEKAAVENKAENKAEKKIEPKTAEQENSKK
ncbi:MAG: hypothetical protein OXC44_00180 [Proteobacteria bacterium]|nr:hypothetical protein [Pseudomonadota bacterium]